MIERLERKGGKIGIGIDDAAFVCRLLEEQYCSEFHSKHIG